MTNNVLNNPKSDNLLGLETEGLTVSIAKTQEEIEAGMAFCGELYQKTYNTCWDVAPDVLFVAKLNGEIIATSGLEIASRHEMIGVEKYFYLTPRMRSFITEHRGQIAEFGRFSSKKREGAKAVLHAMISYCQEVGIQFLFAWANPSVFTHGISKLGCPFWVIDDLPINEENVLNDKEWVTPPTGFFFREEPPRLLLSVIPFFDLVNQKFAEQYGKPLTLLS